MERYFLWCKRVIVVKFFVDVKMERFEFDSVFIKFENVMVDVVVEGS